MIFDEEPQPNSDPKLKQFSAAVDKALKSFDSTTEWADLISSLGKLHKVFVGFSSINYIPKKQIVGKRLAQCLHPALPNGVHLKALECYDVILSQIGTQRLAQDLAIYGPGLYPLLGPASMLVRPALLNLYEKHWLPLGPLLLPSLSGFLLGVLPGVEESSEHTERTVNLLKEMADNCGYEPYYHHLWGCILNSSVVRLSAFLYITRLMASKDIDHLKSTLLIKDKQLMVQALCASMDDDNVLVSRTSLDFLTTLLPCGSALELGEVLFVQLIKAVLMVLLKRDMSLNRRVFHWLFDKTDSLISSRTDLRSESESVVSTDMGISRHFDQIACSYFVTAVRSIFHDSQLRDSDLVSLSSGDTRTLKQLVLRPYRVLISLLDRPEMTWPLLEQVLVVVLRTYQHSHQLLTSARGTFGKFGNGFGGHPQSSQKKSPVDEVRDDLEKCFSIVFNAFEPVHLWDFFAYLVFTSNSSERDILPSQETGSAFPWEGSWLMSSISTYLRASHQDGWPEVFFSTVDQETLTQVMSDILHPRECDDSLLNDQMGLLEAIDLLQLVMETLMLDAELDVQTRHWPVLLARLLVELCLRYPCLSLAEQHGMLRLSSSLLSSVHPYLKSFNLSICVTLSPDRLDEAPDNLSVAQLSLDSRSTVAMSQKEILLLAIGALQAYLYLLPAPFLGRLKTEQCIGLHRAFSSDGQRLRGMDSESLEVFKVATRLMVRFSCFPISQSLEEFSIVSAPNEVTPQKLRPWLATLLDCAIQQWDQHVMSVAAGCFLDLLNITVTVYPQVVEGGCAQMGLGTKVYPLITAQDMVCIRAASIYDRLADSLWNSLHPNRSSESAYLVGLLMLLQGLAPDPTLCTRVITGGLAHTHLPTRRLAHWRFHTVWHYSYKLNFKDQLPASAASRNLDRGMLVMLEGIRSPDPIIHSTACTWLQQAAHQGDLGRIVEPLLLFLLHPTTARVAAPVVTSRTRLSRAELSAGSSPSLMRPTHPDKETNEVRTSKEDESLPWKVPVTILLEGSPGSGSPPLAEQLSIPSSLPVLNTMEGVLLYQLPYDVTSVLFAIKALSDIVRVCGRDGLRALCTQSLGSSNTSNWIVVRDWLVRHHLVQDGQSFHGKVGDVELSAKFSSYCYLELLFVVVSFFIRSYHSASNNSITPEDALGNTHVKMSACDLLTELCRMLTEFRSSCEPGFDRFLREALHACRLQSVVLQCVLFTVTDLLGYQSMPPVQSVVSLHELHQGAYSELSSYLDKLLSLLQALLFLENTFRLDAMADTRPSTKPDTIICNNGVTLPDRPLIAQPLLSSIVISVLKEINIVSSHHTWVRFLLDLLPIFPEPLPALILPVVNQLCQNILVLAKMIVEQNSISIETNPCIITQYVQDLTCLTLYYLISRQTTDPIYAEPLGSEARASKSGDSSSSVDSTSMGLISLFSYPVGESAAKTNGGALETQEALLACLPQLVNAFIVLLNSLDSVSEKADKELLCNSVVDVRKAVHKLVLKCLTPLWQRYPNALLLAFVEVWNRTRENPTLLPKQGDGQSWIFSLLDRLNPAMGFLQTCLLRLMFAIKSIHPEGALEAFKAVLKQLTCGKGQNVTLMELSLIQLLHAYLSQVETETLLGLRGVTISLVKDWVNSGIGAPCMLMVPSVLLLLLQRISVPEDKKLRKELQDLVGKIADNVSTLVVSVLDGSSWFRTRSFFATSEQENLSEWMHQPTNFKSFVSCLAVIVFTECILALYDMVYTQDEKDKVATALSTVVTNFLPFLKNHSSQALNSYRACSAFFSSASQYSYTLRAWKREVFDLLLDASFFSTDNMSLAFFQTSVNCAFSTDVSFMKELLMKISVSLTGSIGLLTNRKQEIDNCALLLKRLAFVIFSGELDQYQHCVPEIQERLTDCLKIAQVPVLHEQVFFCVRVMALRLSPQHLVSIWPALLSELSNILMMVELEVKGDDSSLQTKMMSTLYGSNNVRDLWMALFLSACKLLEMLLLLPSKHMPIVQLSRWVFAATDYTPFVDSSPSMADDDVTSPRPQQAGTTEVPPSPSTFTPILFRIVEHYRRRSLPSSVWNPTPVGIPVLTAFTIASVDQLLPFFRSVALSLYSPVVSCWGSDDRDLARICLGKLLERDFLDQPFAEEVSFKLT